MKKQVADVFKETVLHISSWGIKSAASNFLSLALLSTN